MKKKTVKKQPVVNEYSTAKELLKLNVGQSVTVQIANKEKFRKYLSDLSKKNQMQFITRATNDAKEESLEVSRFK